MIDNLYHGIKWNNTDLMFKIIESGYIHPRCRIDSGIITDENNLFNGTEYISLSEKQKKCEGEIPFFKFSYDDFIQHKVCFVLKREGIDYIRPKVIHMDDISPKMESEIYFNNNGIRYSCYMDEVQTKDSISLKKNLIAVGIPATTFEYKLGEEKYYSLLNDLEKTLKAHNLDVPILNSNIYTFADNEVEMGKSKVKVL